MTLAVPQVYQPQHEPSPTRTDRTATTPRPFHERLVVLEDDELAALAMASKLGLQWDSISLSARHGPERWEQLDMDRDFHGYARQEPHRFSVFTVGVVPGCVGEILNVLQTPTSEQYAQHMAAIFQDQFRDGTIVHRVDVATVARPPLPKRAHHTEATELAELTVKRATFTKPRWFSNREEWSYVDAVYHSVPSRLPIVVEKLMTTMQAKDIRTADNGGTTTSVSSNAVHNVVCGYLLRSGREDPAPAPTTAAKHDNDAAKIVVPRETRVSFYAEFQSPAPAASTPTLKGWRRSVPAPDKTIVQRLLKLAQSTTRLTILVRRQRLGLQVLADATRFLPPTHWPCKVCTRILMVAKLCRLCGHGVCGNCSDKYERVRQPHGKKTLEVSSIRVCAYCLERTDQAEYANLTQSSLLGAFVVCDDAEPSKSPARLRALLQDALLTAPSPTRHASVKRVIQSVLDIERSHRSLSSASSDASSVVLIPSSSDTDYLEALACLEEGHDRASHVPLRSDDHRCYQLDTSGAAAVPTPVPDDEDARLQAVRQMNGADLATVVELEILCELAAREMGCATSAISLVDRDEYYGVASNQSALRNARIPRTQTICSHTMMDKTAPLIVRHPEADIRFCKFDSVRELGVRFYCAFALIGEDDQVIGTMCCLNDTSLEISASQLASFQKLAATASRVMRVETRKRRRKESSTSSGSDAML